MIQGLFPAIFLQVCFAVKLSLVFQVIPREKCVSGMFLPSQGIWKTRVWRRKAILHPFRLCDRGEFGNLELGTKLAKKNSSLLGLLGSMAG